MVSNYLGDAYQQLGNRRKATAYYEQALARAKKTGNRQEEARALTCLGSIQLGQGKDKALEYYEQALIIYLEVGERHMVESTFLSLLNVYYLLRVVSRPLFGYEKELARARKTGNRIREAITSRFVADELAKQGKLERATELLQVCVDFEREIGHRVAEKDAARLEHLRQRLAASQHQPPADASDKG